MTRTNLQKNRGVGVGLVAASVVGVGSVLAATPTANAALTLTLTEPGFAPVTATDTFNTGTVSYIGGFGGFSTNIVFALSDKLTTPTPTVADIQVQSLDIRSTASTAMPQTLTVTVTDDGFTFPTTGTALQLAGSIGGTLTGATAGDNVTFSSTATPTGGSAVSTAVSTFTSSTTSSTSQSFSMLSTPVNFARPTSYTLSDTTTATLSTAGATANLSGATTVITAVPEPAALGLVAAGLGLAGFRRRRAAR